MVNQYKSSDFKLGYETRLRFSLSQHSRDTELMKSLAQHFGCGGYYYGSTGYIGEFVVCAFSDVLNKIIPFFQEYPRIGLKSLDFADFCKVAELMKEGRHLTAEGLAEIQLIKSGMNKGRLIVKNA